MLIKDITKELNPTYNRIYNNTGLTKKIIVPENVFNRPIYQRDNVKEKRKYQNGIEEYIWVSKSTNTASCYTVDTEYQEVGNFCKTQALLNNGRDEDDKKFIHRNNFINFNNDIIKNYLRNYNIDIQDYLLNPVKYSKLILKIPENYLYTDFYSLQSPILITTQIKNTLELEEDGFVYLSDFANKVRENYIKDKPEFAYKFKDYNYPVLRDDITVIEQYMQYQGYEFKIHIVTKEQYYNEILPYHTLNLYVFFGMVDIPFIFQNQYYEEIQRLILKGVINFDKRYKSNYYDDNKKINVNAKPYWIVEINGHRSKVILNFLDACAMQGPIGYKQFLINNDIKVEDKDAFDKSKIFMLENLLKEPELYHKYAIGDIKPLKSAIINFGKNLHEVGELVGIEDKNIEKIEPKYTLGSTVNNIIKTKELQSTNATTKKEKAKFINTYCKSSSSKYLGHINRLEDNQKLCFTKDDSYYIRMELAKLYGGRTNNTNPLLRELYNKDKNKQNFFFDIDMTGAYTTTKSPMFKYYGETVIYLFRGNEQKSFSEIYKIFKKEFGKDNFIIIISGKLDYKQDLISSWFNPEKSSTTEITKDENDNTIIVDKYDFKKSKTMLLNREILNGIITSATLDIILNGFHPQQRDDFLNNLKVTSMLLNPLSMQLDSMEELNIKIEEHNGGIKDHSFKLLSEFIDRQRGNKCNYCYRKNFGDFFIDDIRSLRNLYKKLGITSKEQLFKLIGNTSYGVCVSELFDNSSIMFGNNITGNVRAMMWCMEKSFNIPQSITDGGILDFFNVKYPMWEYLDSREFVDSYKYSSRELSDKKRWYNRQLNYREAILNKKTKKWLLDGVEYEEKPIINNEAYYNEDTKKWIISGVEYDEKTVGIEISKLCIEHLKKCFPKIGIINDMYRCFKLDVDGNILRDENNKPVYSKQQGMFGIEVKNIINKAYFSGLSNYMFINHKGELTIKTRSYETKKDEDGNLRKQHTAILPSNKKGKAFILCEKTYLKTAVTEKFYFDRETNPERVPLLPPYFLELILKTKAYHLRYESTYMYNELIRPGGVIVKLVQKFFFEISQFKFLYIKQQQALYKLNERIKRLYGMDLSIFFLNDDDGTVNVKKMYETINDLINNGVVNFLKELDPHNHINRKIPDCVKEHIQITHLSRQHLRIITVGLVQFDRERGKILEDIIDYNDLDFTDFHKKSHSSEFEFHNKL